MRGKREDLGKEREDGGSRKEMEEGGSRNREGRGRI